MAAHHNYPVAVVSLFGRSVGDGGKPPLKSGRKRTQNPAKMGPIWT